MSLLRGSYGLRSMRARMTALFALLIALLMVGVGLAVGRLERKRARTRVNADLQRAVEVARSEVAEPDERGKPFLDVVQDEQGDIAAGGLTLLVVKGSSVLWCSRAECPAWPHPQTRWKTIMYSQGDETLVIAHDWTPDEEGLNNTNRDIAGIGLCIVLFTAILAWIVVGQTLSPIARLADQSQNATQGGISVRLQAPSSDGEMQHLTSTLNDLLSHLENESRSRGRFYAAASHELRTPLQVLLGQIDVALSRPRTVPEHEATLQELGAQTERLADLVASLLQLNALEMGQIIAAREPLNLAFWVERAIDQQSGALERRDLRIETNLHDVVVNVPPPHVEVLLRNLLENAAKYATSGTIVLASLHNEECSAVLRIENKCLVPQNTDVSQWFEPFFRDDASRSAQTGGNGLGLSIVAALARANGWKVDLNITNGVIAVTVCFPAST